MIHFLIDRIFMMIKIKTIIISIFAINLDYYDSIEMFVHEEDSFNVFSII